MMSEEKLKSVNEAGNENPWYVLMTIAGEQGKEGNIDQERHKKNRRYWNGRAPRTLSPERKKQLIAENQAEESDFAPLSFLEKTAIKNAMKKRCPEQK